MLRPNPTEWPTWHDDPWQNEQPRGPLRHDIALTRYLEKQRACRASTVRGFDLRTTAIRLWQAVVYIAHGFFSSGVPSTGAFEQRFDQRIGFPSAVRTAGQIDQPR